MSGSQPPLTIPCWGVWPDEPRFMPNAYYGSSAADFSGPSQSLPPVQACPNCAANPGMGNVITQASSNEAASPRIAPVNVRSNFTCTSSSATIKCPGDASADSQMMIAPGFTETGMDSFTVTDASITGPSADRRSGTESITSAGTTPQVVAVTNFPGDLLPDRGGVNIGSPARPMRQSAIRPRIARTPPRTRVASTPLIARSTQPCTPNRQP